MFSRQALHGIVLFVLFALPAFAGINRWTIKGPGGGNVSKLAYDPVDPSIAYAASDNGIFRSSDGGQHWAGAAELLGTAVFDVAVANSDPQKVFASTAYGLYKSSDRGVTWQTVHPFASFKLAVASQNANVVYSVATSGPIRSSDGGVTFGNTGSGLPSPIASVSALAVDPQNVDTVYASFLSSAGVYKSMDGGGHWTAANSGLTLSQYYSLIIDPSNGSTLYVGAGGALYKTTDGGTTWSPMTTTLQSAYYYSISISTAAPSIIIAGTNQGMIKTGNGGSIWFPSVPPNSGAVTSVAIDPLHPENALIVAAFTIFRTKDASDGGTSYTTSSSGLAAYYTQAIAVDPQNAAIVYASGSAGIFKSTDRGETWSSAGPLATYLVVDPFNSLTLYAISSGAFRRSVDGGGVWQDFKTGLPAGSAIVIAPDPQVPGTLYTIVGNAVYKKVGTDPWAIRKTGLPASGFPSFITIDPHNSSTLYTGGAFGVFKSIDGGANWAAATNGLNGLSPTGLAVDPFDSNHLFAWSNSSAYESTDAGANWIAFTSNQGIVLAFDPSAAGHVYLSTSSEVDRSADGGKTWFPLTAGLGRTHGNIFVIARDGSTLYTGGTTGGVWAFTYARQRAVRK